MKLLGYELTLKKIAKETPNQKLVRLAEEITKAWHVCQCTGAGLSPWIDWQTKELQVTKFSGRQVVAREDV